MQLKRVVVTGLGALTPIGNTLQEYWDGLVNGKSGAAPITYYDTEKHKTKFACEIKNFNVEDFIDKKEVRRMDKFAQYAIVASDEAIKDAGISLENVNKHRVGVISAHTLLLITILKSIKPNLLVKLKTSMLKILSTKKRFYASRIVTGKQIGRAHV